LVGLDESFDALGGPAQGTQPWEVALSILLALGCEVPLTSLRCSLGPTRSPSHHARPPCERHDTAADYRRGVGPGVEEDEAEALS
jgi:hypothetical protein